MKYRVAKMLINDEAKQSALLASSVPYFVETNALSILKNFYEH